MSTPSRRPRSKTSLRPSRGPKRSLRAVSAKQPWDDTLSDAQYNKLRTLIEARLGFRMPPTKRVLLHGRMVRRARALHVPSLSAYCERVLDDPESGSEIGHFLDIVTTNVTSFFREPQQLERVQDALTRWAKAGSRELRVWSAACSRGHEVWTLAMMLAELPGAPSFSLLGTDVSSRVLSEAVSAVYPEAELAPVPATWRKRYFMHSRDRTARLARVVPELRQTAQFAKQNLMDNELNAPRDFDLVLLRNVLIYFDSPTQAAVVAKVASHLKVGGLLCVGLAESLHGRSAGLEHLELGIYRREGSR